MNQTNFVLDNDILPFLHSNCHHQIVYAKLNLKSEPLPPPPLYERLVWGNKNANTQLLNHTNKIFNCEKLLENNSVNEQLYLVNKAMLNIFHSFNPNEGIICWDKSDPRLNNKVKILTEKKNNIFNNYMAKWLIVD